MTKGLMNKLFGMLTGALIGYMWGWIWGWSLYDPNSDLWALAAAIVSLLGLIFGAITYLRRFGELIIVMTLGLYLSWIVRTILFGDEPGGWGVIVMLGGIILSILLWKRFIHFADKAFLPILLGVLYIGFFGGFLIEIAFLDKVFGLVKTHSILSQAPAVLASGIIGGIVMAIMKGRLAPVHNSNEKNNN